MINRAMFQVPLAIWTLPMKQPRPSSPARRWAAASALFWRIFLESTWSPFHGSLRSSNTQNHATWGAAREDGLLSGKGVTDERRGPQAWGGESRCQTHIGQH